MQRMIVCFSILLGSLASPCHAAIIYSNDFETNTVGFSAGTQNTFFNGVSNSQFLGKFSGTNPSSTNLSLSGLQAGNTYTLTFDLYAGVTLDGSNPSVGPDVFTVTAGTTTLLDASFGNFPGVASHRQTYSDATPLGDGGLFDGQTGIDALGGYRKSSIYRFDGIGPNPIFTFVATGTTETISFVSNGLQHAGDEFFAIDNVVVTGSDVVPEPTTLAIWSMLGGIGLVAGRRRRKRGTT